MYQLCDFKTLCFFFLAVSWFGRVYIAMEKSHREEIIMNRKLKTDFKVLVTKVTKNCRLTLLYIVLNLDFGSFCLSHMML